MCTFLKKLNRMLLGCLVWGTQLKNCIYFLNFFNDLNNYIFKDRENSVAKENKYETMIVSDSAALEGDIH